MFRHYRRNNNMKLANLDTNGTYWSWNLFHYGRLKYCNKQNLHLRTSHNRTSSIGSCSVMGKPLCYHVSDSSSISRGGHNNRSRYLLTLLGQRSIYDPGSVGRTRFDSLNGTSVQVCIVLVYIIHLSQDSSSEYLC